MVEKLSTTDLSRGKTSMDCLTRLIANLVVEYTVDFQFDLLLFIVLGSIAHSEGLGYLPCPIPVTNCVGSWVELSGLGGKVVS